jgi:hypothetical protein
LHDAEFTMHDIWNKYVHKYPGCVSVYIFYDLSEDNNNEALSLFKDFS